MDGEKEWTQKYIFDPRTANASASASTPTPASTPAARTQEFPDPDRHSVTRGQPKPMRRQSARISAANNIPAPPTSPSSSLSASRLNAPLPDTPSQARRRHPRESHPRIEAPGARSVAASTRPPTYRTSLPQSHSSSGPPTRPRSSSAQASNTPSSQRRGSNVRTHTRNNSLPQRFAGDMSNRPLDMVKRETKTANRRHRRGDSHADTIDALDTIGGSYHHDGPYEATLASRNTNTKYSPVAAVRDSNMEALRATPQEYVKDSLTRHVPLQGTSVIPSGGYDLSGNVITYEEGADLMREQDAPGGPYKRWDGIRYHPDDFKGKGEPSFTYERDAKIKERERLLRRDRQAAGDFELQPSGRQQRSASNGAYDARATGLSTNGDMHRSHTTGKRLGEGLKRRLGSLRRKKDMPTEQVH